MIIDRPRYNEEYYPTKHSIEFYHWFKSFFTENNKTPQTHFMLIDHINSKNKRKGVECHRGFAKSTLMRYNIAYWFFKGKKPNFGEFDYILLIQETVEMVAGTIDTISSLIEDTDLKRFLKIEKKTLGDNPTLWVRNIELDKVMYIKGKGAGQAIRGINIRGKRPNIIICDDIENEKKQSTKESMEKLKAWFYGSVTPAVDKSHYEFIFIGTPIHEDALLVELERTDSWKFIKLPVAEKFPCSKDEFVGSWEDRFGYDDLIEDYNELRTNGREGYFMQEYMLEIVPSDDLLYDIGKINKFKIEDIKKIYGDLTYYISVDPAISERESADYTSIAIIGINSNGDWFLVDGKFGRMKPNEMIDSIFEFYMRWKPYEVIIEGVAYQRVLKPIIEQEMFKRKMFFSIKMLQKNRNTSKLYVFKSFQPIVESIKFWIPEDYLKDFVNELIYEMSYITNKAIKSKHDDILDSIAQLVLAEPIYAGSNVRIEQNNNGFGSSFLTYDTKNSYVF